MLLEVEEKEPSYEVIYAIALGYYKLRNFNQTFKYLHLARAAPQADIRVHLLSAKYYRKKGDLNKALEVLTKLKEQNSGNLEVLFLIADIYRLKGCFNNAIEYYDVR